MADQFYETKIRKFFDLLDLNKDNHLALEDFLGAADRGAKAFGFADDSPEHIGLRSYYVSLWDEVYAPMDADGDQSLTFVEMLTAHENTILDKPGGYEKLKPVAQGFMIIGDSDHDGAVTREEFIRCMHNAFNVAVTAAADGFDAIDSDRSGNLTHDELHEAAQDFFCHSTPDAPGNSLFGPI